jgi:hypothetical protein
MIRKYGKDALIIFFLLAVFYAYFFQNPGANENSRFALIFAAVQEGRLNIDSFHDVDGTNTIDKAYYEGHYYSDKAIGPSVVGGIFYLPLYWLQQLIHHPSLYTTKRILTFLIIGIPSAAAGGFLFILSMHLSKSRLTAFLVAVAVGLGTICLPYSTALYSHQFTASLLFTAFFLIFLIKESPGRPGNGHMFLIGSLLGWALISEYLAALIIFALIGYYIFVVGRRPDYRSVPAVTLPILGGLFPILLQLTYNRLCFGNFLSIGYANESDKIFYLGMRQGLMGIHWPDLPTMFYLTFHPSLGLFWQSPVLLFSFLGAGFLLYKGSYRAELILAVWVICSYIVALSGYYMWWGGWAVGVRHFIPMLPFFSILLSFVPKRLIWLFAGLSVVSVAQMIIATASTIAVPETMALKINTLGFFEYSNIYSYCWQQLAEGNFAMNLGLFPLGLKSWSSLLPLLAGVTGITVFFFWRGDYSSPD